MKRDNMMIQTELLIRAYTAKKPTNLFSDTRLAYRPFMKLIENLLRLGLLELVPVIEGKTRVKYRTTEKGRDFVKRVLECYKMMEDEYMTTLIKKVRYG